ncbi:MAG: class I SAM-dependent methyltransferase [Myxococcales bacterium]|nr:class I SAM-dependent methyltransferase [Myxococcales bacterium]
MPAEANAEQSEYWNRIAGPRWVRMQAGLDAQLDPLGAIALARAALRAGDRVVDVGCGCGASSLRAAGQVGREGSVLGVDLSEPMLAHARERAAAADVENVIFERADAQTHAFAANGADAIVSRFGVMFFSAPEAAFANLRGALVPEGRLSFVCWQPIERNPWMAAPTAAAARLLPMPAPPEPDAPGPFSFADPERVRGILAAAGFAEIRIDPHEDRLSVGGARTPEEAGEFLLGLGPVGRALAEADADAALRERVAAAVCESMIPFTDASGVHAPCAAWVVTARAPAAAR